MSEEIDVSVGDDVVIDAPVEEPKVEESTEDKTDEVAGEEPTKEDASTEQAEEEKPKKSRFQERVDELTKQREDAKREAEFWKAKAESSEGNKKELAEHEAEKAETKINAVDAQAWQAKIDLARERHPEYDSVVSKSNAHVEPHVAKSVLESEIGPELFLHFANNPEVLEKINGMNPRAAEKEILRLEVMLETKPQTAPPVFKKTSTAPEPVKPVNSNRGVVQKDPSEMNQAEYESWRKKNGASWARNN
jgi:hypothetical protein